MTMEGDGCNYCKTTEKDIEKIAIQLDCLKGEQNKCAATSKRLNGVYSRPVLLQVNYLE